MRELRKETEIYSLIVNIRISTQEIRNERTPKGDGNYPSSFLFVAIVLK